MVTLKKAKPQIMNYLRNPKALQMHNNTITFYYIYYNIFIGLTLFSNLHKLFGYLGSNNINER